MFIVVGIYYSIFGSYCLPKRSYIAPFLPLVLLGYLLSTLQHHLSTGYEPRCSSVTQLTQARENALFDTSQEWEENSRTGPYS